MATNPTASDHDRSNVAVEDGNPTEIAFMDAHLYKATARGDTDVLRFVSPDELLLQLTPQRNTLLHIASQFGRLGSVNFILELHSSSYLLQQPNLKGETALHLAAREGYCEVVKALIHAAKSVHQEIESDVGADKVMMRMTDEKGGTALHEAVRYNHLEVVKLLVEEDPDFTYGADSSGYTPLYMAAERGNGNLVKIIIENTRTSPSHNGILGRTALHAAVIQKNLEMTRRILEWKPILAKEVDEEGWSPLHCTAASTDWVGAAVITNELLNISPDKSVIYLGIKGSKMTALHIAVLFGNKNLVQLLLFHAPDCSEQADANGNNAFHFAMMCGYRPNFASALLNMDELRVRGLVNEKDNQGDTPLHLLVSFPVEDTDFMIDEIVDMSNLINAWEKMAPEANFSSRGMFKIFRDMLVSVSQGDARRPNRRLQEAMDERKKRAKEVREKEEIEDDKSSDNYLRETGEKPLVVAALIATVTFAAGFALLCGYGSGDGMAGLSKKASFKAFVVSDAIALSSSVGAVFFYFLNAMPGLMDSKRVGLLLCGHRFTLFGMVAIVVAFATGLYAVLPLPLAVSILTLCMAICCFVVFLTWRMFRTPRG